jgi:hypothetical protein
MPQYIRENGAIKVIPDDRTTEDGEIDLSPRRKIIDEGNIVIEGRDDGSTVIREKRPTDHTFFGEEIVSKEYEFSDFDNAGPFVNTFYDNANDLYLLAGTSGVLTLDGSTLEKINEESSLSNTRYADFHQATQKVFLARNNVIHVYSYNDSVGYYEKKQNTITLSGETGINRLDVLAFDNTLVAFGDEEMWFVDPINESILGSDDSAGLNENGSVGGGLDQSSISTPRKDRFFYVNKDRVFRIINTSTRSANNLDGVFPEASDYCYLERLDVLVVNDYNNGEAVIYDASTLSEVNRVNHGFTGDFGYIVPFEGRFFSVSSGDVFNSNPSEVKLYDPLTGDFLDSYGVLDKGQKPVSFGNGEIFVVSRQKTLLSGVGLVVKKIEYSPFYS